MLQPYICVNFAENRHRTFDARFDRPRNLHTSYRSVDPYHGVHGPTADGAIPDLPRAALAGSDMTASIEESVHLGFVADLAKCQLLVRDFVRHDALAVSS